MFLSSNPLTLNKHYSDVFLFQQSHLFDNVGTVFFAIFMGIWGMYSLWGSVLQLNGATYWSDATKTIKLYHRVQTFF